MEFEVLEPVSKKGFEKLEVVMEGEKVGKFVLVTKPRKLENLVQGELEMRTEIQLTLGSDLITYGLDKMLLIIKELMGRGDKPMTSTLKYDVVRFKPEVTEKEKQRLEKLYYQKVNAPVAKFIDALGPRVKKVREFLKDADEVIREETREVAAKEIVDRIRKATVDFGFDFDRITKRAGEILGRVADIVGEAGGQEGKYQDYQALVRKKTAQKDVETKPQVIIVQQKGILQIAGGNTFDAHFDNISPELLFDTLRLYLLTKVPIEKSKKMTEKA